MPAKSSFLGFYVSGAEETRLYMCSLLRGRGSMTLCEVGDPGSGAVMICIERQRRCARRARGNKWDDETEQGGTKKQPAGHMRYNQQSEFVAVQVVSFPPAHTEEA